MTDAYINELTQQEIRKYVELGKKLVLKKQETADAEEAVVFSRLSPANPDFSNIQDADEVWELRRVYVEASQIYDGTNNNVLKPVVNRGQYYLDTRKSWTSIYKDNDRYHIGDNDRAYLFFNNRNLFIYVVSANERDRFISVSTGKEYLNYYDISSDPDGIATSSYKWIDLDLDGNIYYDLIPDTSIKFYLEVDAYVEQRTRRISTSPNGDQVVREAPPVNYGEGLSAIISTPQEYVIVKLLYGKNGEGYPANQRDGVKAAIENFEANGDFTDRRKPEFELDSNGVQIQGQPNPEYHLVNIAYRGEHNIYYRQLWIDHEITPFVSRSTGQFEVMNHDNPPIVDGLSDHAIRQFIRIHNECAKVFKRLMFNDAYMGDKLYPDFCRLFITWMAIVRMLNEQLGVSNDIDHMEKYDLVNLLYSYGFYDLNNLNSVYQKRFLKQINYLLSVKGTDQAIKDILGLFKLGEELKIWKYSIVKYYPHKKKKLIYRRSASWKGNTPSLTLGSTTISGENLPPFRRLVLFFNRNRRNRNWHNHFKSIASVEIIREDRDMNTHKVIRTDLEIQRTEMEDESNAADVTFSSTNTGDSSTSWDVENKKVFTFIRQDGDWSDVPEMFFNGRSDIIDEMLRNSPLRDLALLAEEYDVEGVNKIEANNTEIQVSIKDPNGTNPLSVDGSLTFGEVLDNEEGDTDYRSPEVGFYRKDLNNRNREEEIKDLNHLNIIPYDTFIKSDPYWRTTESAAKKIDFSSLETKYFTVTSGLDIIRNGIAMSFLWGAFKEIADKKIDVNVREPKFPSTINNISNITIFQSLVGLKILSLAAVGADDIIPHGESGVRTIIDANRQYTRNERDNDLFGSTANNLVNPIKFSDVENSGNVDRIIESVDNEMDIYGLYQRRMASYGKVLIAGDDPNHQYARWKEMNEKWKARYVANFQSGTFGNKEHYTDWLKEENSAFGTWIESSKEGTLAEIQEDINILVVALEDLIDSDNINFATSSGFSTEQIIYLRSLLNYFKSYTVDFKDISISFNLFESRI